MVSHRQEAHTRVVTHRTNLGQEALLPAAPHLINRQVQRLSSIVEVVLVVIDDEVVLSL